MLHIHELEIVSKSDDRVNVYMSREQAADIIQQLARQLGDDDEDIALHLIVKADKPVLIPGA